MPELAPVTTYERLLQSTCRGLRKSAGFQLPDIVLQGDRLAREAIAKEAL
jgi:hypothetical protein